MSAWWEGKSCKELEGVRVRVEYENGATAEGVLNTFGDIIRTEPDNDGDYDVIDVACNRKWTAPGRFRPLPSVRSITRIDSADDYEHVERFDDIWEGDVIVTDTGNRYRAASESERTETGVTVTLPDSADPSCPEDERAHVVIPRTRVSTVLRRKAKLPDRPGLWVDNVGALWVVDESKSRVIRNGSGQWVADWNCLSSSSRRLRDGAPFHPYRPDVGRKENQNESAA